MKKKQQGKIPVCEKCGMVLNGRVPEGTRVVCYLCNNPPPNPRKVRQRDKR